MIKRLYPLLGNRSVLWLLFWVNVLGTAYGYYWYKWQLIDTPPLFLLFVPDSPTASLFFVFVLGAFLMGKNWPLMEALAIVSLVKYGLWAVVMNMMVFFVSGQLDWIGLMLMASHFAMAVEGVLYAPFYRMKPWHLIVAGIVVVHNEIIDYVFKMMPRYHTLDLYMDQIGYFTFWLSIFSIAVGYYFGLRPERFSLSLKRSR